MACTIADHRPLQWAGSHRLIDCTGLIDCGIPGSSASLSKSQQHHAGGGGAADEDAVAERVQPNELTLQGPRSVM